MVATDALDDSLVPVTPILAPLKDSEHQSARTRTRGPANLRALNQSATDGIASGSAFTTTSAKRSDASNTSSAETAAIVPPLAAQHQASAANAANNFPSVVSAVYALRRGGNRTETLAAVDNLIQLCNFGGELCLLAVKQIMAAGGYSLVAMLMTSIHDVSSFFAHGF